jgi:protein-tyrosine-phosphatase
LDPVRILFICSNNTGRSYIAQQIAQRYVERAGLKGLVSFDSAGFSAITGMPASPAAVSALKELGYEAGYHRARNWLDIAVDNFDIIFVFEHWQVEYVKSEFPELKEKILLMGNLFNLHPELFAFSNSWREKVSKLKEYSIKSDFEIKDPVIESERIYLNLSRDIEKCIKNLIYYLFGR